MNIPSRLRSKMDRSTEDVSILVLGDSTGDDSTEWVRLLTGHLATHWPTHTVIYHSWDETTVVYRPAVTVQTGTGPTLHVWNGSAAGQSTRYSLAPAFQSLVIDTDPDLVLVSHGHNEGSDTGTDQDRERWRGQMSALTETVAYELPDAAISIVIQNPRRHQPLVQAQRASLYSSMAAARGYGIIDVHSAYTANPTWGTDWMRDDIHPNEAGSVAWAQAVYDDLAADTMNTQGPSTFSRRNQSLLGTNGRFTAHTAALPPGWTLGPNSIAVKADICENEGGQMAVKVHGAVDARIRYMLPEWTTGHILTAAMRVFIPTGAPLTAGRVALQDADGYTITRGDKREPNGDWVWVVTTRRMGITPSVAIFGDTDGVAVDRISVVPGVWPVEV